MRDVVSTLNQEVMELEHFGRILTDSQRQRADLPTTASAEATEEGGEEEDLLTTAQPEEPAEHKTIFYQKRTVRTE